MKLAQNGANTLRISLSAEDMEAFQLRPEQLDYDLPDGKRIIRDLFDRARREIGFDATAEKVYIQLYPKKDGGCELFVIKLEEDEEKECYVFDSLDAYLSAKSLFSKTDEISCYRIKKTERFFILAPSVGIPPQLSEYGDRMKRAPSFCFLKARCQRIST